MGDPADKQRRQVSLRKNKRSGEDRAKILLLFPSPSLKAKWLEFQRNPLWSALEAAHRCRGGEVHGAKPPQFQRACLVWEEMSELGMSWASQ